MYEYFAVAIYFSLTACMPVYLPSASLSDCLLSSFYTASFARLPVYTCIPACVLACQPHSLTHSLTQSLTLCFSLSMSPYSSHLLFFDVILLGSFFFLIQLVSFLNRLPSLLS